MLVLFEQWNHSRNQRYPCFTNEHFLWNAYLHARASPFVRRGMTGCPAVRDEEEPVSEGCLIIPLDCSRNRSFHWAMAHRFPLSGGNWISISIRPIIAAPPLLVSPGLVFRGAVGVLSYRME